MKPILLSSEIKDNSNTNSWILFDFKNMWKLADS